MATNPRKRNLRIQGRMQMFRTIIQKALNLDLALPFYGRGPALQSPLKNMDLQNKNMSKNKNMSVVTKL